jgi:hypothetical protein
VSRSVQPGLRGTISPHLAGGQYRLRQASVYEQGKGAGAAALACAYVGGYGTDRDDEASTSWCYGYQPARLGHSEGGATTLRHYADPVPEVDRRAAAYLAKLTAGSAAQSR